ncbi:hypothetical protein BD779DRAFT_509614 [Infundibulicybe gibba]|nr:hypothetical protein BD779DRAFT_509614 [Infundibulicybe gibba]
MQGSPASNAPSMIPSIRRTSTNETSISQSPAPPPSPNLSSTSFTRSLRSLLPFGPNKPATPVSASVSPRSPFASFGSVRKSMTRDRKASETLPPVMAISRLPDDPHDETGVRRSFSCSQLEEKQRRDQDFSTEAEAIVMPDPIARPPDADLSTIIEADTSGISNQVPTPARSRSHSPVPPAHSTPVPVLSTLPASPITKLDPDASFNLSALDPDLAELLSPRRQPAFDLTPSPSSPSFPADSFAPPPSSLPRLRPGNSNHADTSSVRRTAPPSPLANSTPSLHLHGSQSHLHT